MYSYWKLVNIIGDESAYETYRDASNYICNFQLIWAIHSGYSIAHGTTSTNNRVAKSLFPSLKKLGYNLDIHVLFATAEARKASLLHRLKVQDFYQVTPTDATSKVAPVYMRIIDAYLKYADTMTMYYNMGNFWLNKSAAESAKSLKTFATFDRKTNSNVIVHPNYYAIIDILSTEVIETFKSWLNKQS